MSESTGKKRKNKSLSVKDFIDGSIFTTDFVAKQSGLLMLIAWLVVAYISNDYDCRKKMTKIEDLKEQLKDVKYENLVISTELTSHSRQSQVEELLAARGINLSGSSNPAFEIHK
jgi:hypothetical protein